MIARGFCSNFFLVTASLYMTLVSFSVVTSHCSRTKVQFFLQFQSFIKTMWLTVILQDIVVSITASLVLGSPSVCHEKQSLSLLKNEVCLSQDSANNQSCDNCYVELDDTEIYIEDLKAGTINVEFKLYPACCNYTRYDIKLEIKKDELNITCGFANDEYVFHSKKFLEIYNSNVTSCKEKANVTFNNVFTGCYHLNITPEPIQWLRKSYYKFIETEYRKTKLLGKIPKIFPKVNFNCERNMSTFDFSIIDLHKFNVSSLEVQYRRCDDSTLQCQMCSLCNYWTIEIDWNKIGGPVCGKKVNNVDATCRLNNDLLMCTVQNISAGGFYCVIVHFFDDRCEGDSTWGGVNDSDYSCSFTSVLENATAELLCTKGTFIMPTSAVPFAVGGVIVVLFVISVCLGIYICRKKTHRSINTRPDRELEVQKPQILLLYPHDCKEFMDLMTSFKILLKEYTKCEVFDYFDESNAENIGNNKVAWIRRHIMNAEEKILIVETQCAVLHQQALMTNSKIRYFKPHWLDDLFIYALKTLMEDITNNTYERVFVVRIEGFTDDKNELQHLCPFTRFVIPQHFKVLISQLCQYQNEYCVSLSDDDKLEEMIKLLTCYKADNPQYLNQLTQIVVINNQHGKS